MTKAKKTLTLKSGKGKLNKSKGGIRDARLKLIKKNRRSVGDARDKLVKLAKTTDARQKLEKIRNLKDGKFDVKKTKKGGITITTTMAGKMVLTTRKNDKSSGKNGSTTTKKSIGKNLTQTSKNGKISGIQTKSKAAAASKSSSAARNENNKKSISGSLKKRDNLPLTRTIRGRMSESDKLDQELMNTRVDPVVLKRTVRQNVRSGGGGGGSLRRQRSLSPVDYSPIHQRSRHALSASSLPTGRSPVYDFYDRPRRNRSPLTSSRRSPYLMRRSRSRSPIDYYAPPPRMHYDYDDPRIAEREDEILRQRQRVKEERGLYRRLPAESSSSSNHGIARFSENSGTKVIVSNLQLSVSEDDILELFGEIGDLKQMKQTKPGTAEVVFYNYEDAQKAVETYHNRALDARPMKCILVK